MKEISIVINARVESTRMNKKLIRKFADTTLIDIALNNLYKIKNIKNKYIAAVEKNIIDKVLQYNKDIKILNRSIESVKSGSHKSFFKKTFGHYKDIPTKYIMILNPCFPFLEVLTIENALDFFKKNKQIKSMTSVITSENVFFNEYKEPINLHKKDNASTRWNKKIYEMAHMFHIFDKEYFVEKGFLWSYEKNDPYLYDTPVKPKCFNFRI